MTLHPVRGHDELRAALSGARRAGTLPASLLLHGAPGVGKQRLALWTAQLLLCEAPDAAGPCSRCRPCRLALRLEHPDLHWHFPLPRPRGASTPEKLAEALEDARGAELAASREQPLRARWGEEPRAHYLAAARTVRRRAQRRPSMAAVQVFIVGDAETLVPQESSPEAANALLKLLEEPPGETHFILTSSEPGRLLDTIRSRCLPLHVAPLARDDVRAFLLEEADVPEDVAERVAGLARGSIGRALGFVAGDDGGPLEALRIQALELVESALSPPGRGFSTALGYGPAGARGLLDLFGSVEEWLRDLAAVAAGAPDTVLHRDRMETLRRLAAGVDPVAAAAAVDTVEEAREQARGNVNPQLIVTGLVSRLRRELGSPRVA